MENKARMVGPLGFTVMSWNALKAWYERWNRDDNNWQYLDSFFKPIVLRFFITWFALAPLVAGLLDDYSEWFELPFSWWILWLASLFYSLAFLIHSFFCPSFVKKYPSAIAYEARGHSPRYIVWQCYYLWKAADKVGSEKLAKRLVDKGYASEAEDLEQCSGDAFPTKPEVLQKGTRVFFMNNQKIFELSVSEHDSHEKVRDIFWEVMARWAQQYDFWRNLVWCLIIVSFILVLVTVIEDICFVGSILF